MSYTRPSASAADATWLGAAAYTRPAQSAADATWAPSEALVNLVATVPITAALSLSHGVVAGIAASLPITAALELEHVFAGANIDVAARVYVEAAIGVAHGVSVGVAASVPISAVYSAGHGVAVDVVAAALRISASLAILVPRYEVRGEVRLGGVLVNRRVRCSKRATGELMGQADTVAGVYRVHAGFDEAEVYVTAIDMAEAATDWAPPTANRLVPVLASDTA